MKITTFNPLILTKDPESAIKVFEELGFKRRHTKEGIGMFGATNVRMKDVEEAQTRIVGIIRSLEEQGEIVIMKGGKDDIIA